MKTKWSATLTLSALMTLASCGSEQFGTTPVSNTSKPDALRVYEHHSCTDRTLIAPKVDILYVVDNSASSIEIKTSVKTAVRNTINSISKDFDYRVIGTTLLETPGDTNAFDDYRVFASSNDVLPAEAMAKRVLTADELTFFTNPIREYSPEKGLGRTLSFLEHHKDTGLFRKGAYHLVILVSNGRDTEVEYLENGVLRSDSTAFTSRYNRFVALKGASALDSQQLRFMSVTAKTSCNDSFSSEHSYIKMANQLYADSAATDNNALRDSYDICGSGLNSLFAAVNTSIQKTIIPHQYRYWPITFATQANSETSFGTVEVYRVSESGGRTLIPKTSGWSWHQESDGSLNIRGDGGTDIVNGYHHFVRFTDLVSYPDCVLIKTVSRTEYFGFVVLQRQPRPETIHLTINGRVIPQSATDGWTYIGLATKENIKVAHPDSPGSQEPPIARSGFMIQLNGTGNYYKSGDDVQVNFLPAPI